MSKHDISVRILVSNPIAGVRIQVQRGKDELLPPARESRNELVFEFPISVDMSADTPDFLGKYVQGPKDARFVYVNSGKQAGQQDTCWDRRAKISLMSIAKTQIEEVIALPQKSLEVSFNGTGSDGGPTCASVKGIEWKVVKK
jgi:hypothetical protein